MYMRNVKRIVVTKLIRRGTGLCLDIANMIYEYISINDYLDLIVNNIESDYEWRDIFDQYTRLVNLIDF